MRESHARNEGARGGEGAGSGVGWTIEGAGRNAVRSAGAFVSRQPQLPAPCGEGDARSGRA